MSSGSTGTPVTPTVLKDPLRKPRLYEAYSIASSVTSYSNDSLYVGSDQVSSKSNGESCGAPGGTGRGPTSTPFMNKAFRPVSSFLSSVYRAPRVIRALSVRL